MVRQLILTWAGLLSLTTGPAIGAANFVPRYRFVPGQQLKYHENYSIKYWRADRSSVIDTKADAVVRVVRQNNDGSFRLVFAMRDTSTKTAQGKTTQDATNSIFYADVFPDGRELPMDWPRFAWTTGAFFPPLPKDEAEATNGWEGRAQEYEFKSRRVESQPAFVFETQVSSPALRTLGDTRTVTLTFDQDKGFISRIQDKFKRESRINGEGGGVIELTSLRTLPPDELSRYARESDSYFAAVNAYDAAMTTAESGTREQVAQATADASSRFKEVVNNLSSPDLKADGQEILKGHKDRSDHVYKVIEDRTARVGKPAPDFETIDVDGKKVRLADFRGKVVVLDFWYRGCAWCAKTTPQMNQLANDFAGKPVAVIGMSIDKDVSDSLYVIKSLGIKYPTLRAEGLSERFGVEGYPTMILIDPQGVVRKIEVGYSPTLRKDLGTQIRELIK